MRLSSPLKVSRGPRRAELKVIDKIVVGLKFHS